MSSYGLLAGGLEEALNAVIALDAYTRQQLAGFAGKLIEIELRGADLRIGLAPQADGRLRVQLPPAGAVDARLSGSPLDLLAATDESQAPRQLFAGHLTIEGDTGLGQAFGRVLGGLQIDWEEQLSRLVGDVAAHEAGNAVRAGGRYLQQQRQALERDLGEYLSEEAQLTPPAAELEDFCRRIESLREDADRIAARIQRLQARLARLEPEA